MRAGEIDLSSLQFPLVLRPSTPLTDCDLLRFSAENNAWRIERTSEGDLTIMTPVNGVGSNHEAYVVRSLSMWAEADGRGLDFSPSAGFNLKDGSTLSPDAAWISFKRWNALTEEERNSFPPVCPEFLVELRSKSELRKVMEQKMLKWMDNGAVLAWLVDPLQGTVTIYRAGREAETLERPDFVTASEPVAGFTLPCARLWASAG